MPPMEDYEYTDYDLPDNVGQIPDSFFAYILFKFDEWFDSLALLAQVFFVLFFSVLFLFIIYFLYCYLTSIPLETVIGGHLSKQRLWMQYEHLKQPGVIWFDNKVVRYPPSVFEVKLIQKLEVWLQELHYE